MVTGDATDPDVLRNLGVSQFSHAVVAIGDNIEASILATAALADLKVEKIWAKAITDAHRSILERVGATKVVFPERDGGHRLAHQVAGQMMDYFEIDEGEFILVETGPPADVEGQTLQEAQLRARYGVTVVSVKAQGGSFTHTTPETVLARGSVLLVAGDKQSVEKFAAGHVTTVATEHPIEATGLVKRYGEKTALGGIDLDVPTGTVTAVLGPNGAGKTTAVRILTTLSVADEGYATVAGFDVAATPPRSAAASAWPPRTPPSTRCSPGARTW